MPNNLATKIAAASEAVGALTTDKRNTQQNYDYISADKILDRVGGALARVGVVVIPAIVDEEMVAHSTSNGKERYDARVTFNMTVSDGETTMEFPWVGRGNDYSVPDKATYKAITSGHKYFLAKLLNVGVGNEDGEHEAEPRQVAPRQVAPRQPLDNSLKNVWDEATEIPTDAGDATDFAPYARIFQNPDIKLPERVSALIQYIRTISKEDSTPMTIEQYGQLAKGLDRVIGEGAAVHGMILSCLTGKPIMSNNRPAVKVTVIIDWVKNPGANQTKIDILKQVRDICIGLPQPETETANA